MNDPLRFSDKVIFQSATLGQFPTGSNSEAVKRLTNAGTPAILVRRETVTTDIEGMALAAGILTGSGGRTSHAAVVARQLGKVCLVACPGIEVDLSRRRCQVGGTVYAGSLIPLTERPERALAAITAWRRAGSA